MQKHIFFGKEIINRVSFLREDSKFIIKAIEFPDTTLLFIKNNNPLVTRTENETKTLFKLKISKIPAIHDTLKRWAVLDSEKSIGLRDFNFNIFFMGIMAKNDSIDFQYHNGSNTYTGIPYFMIDITKDDVMISSLSNISNIETLIDRKEIMSLSNDDASLFSYGKMYIDWLGKQNFCPQCGSPVIKINSGSKLSCTNNSCDSKKLSVSNIQFPRTDPAVIVALVNEDFSKILLANAKRSPSSKFYSCIAGFMEPGETIETCCQREVWEETGVNCDNFSIIKSQPWPFPVNLMIGCIGIVNFNGENEIINLGNDPELRDAKWFDVEYIKTILAGNADDMVIPNETAIANHLIKAVLNKNVSKL